MAQVAAATSNSASPPSLGDIITLDRIALNTSCSSKKKVLEKTSHLLASGAIGLDKRKVADCLMARERLGSTGLGYGVAIPHGRCDEINHSIAAFVKTSEPVDYEAADNQPVDLLIALLVPQTCNDGHLQLLAQIAELFNDASTRTKLRSAESPETIFQLLAGPDSMR